VARCCLGVVLLVNVNVVSLFADVKAELRELVRLGGVNLKEEVWRALHMFTFHERSRLKFPCHFSFSGV
jgi:hypothetical protein